MASRRVVIIAVAATLVIVGVISMLFYCYARDTLAEWFSTLLATFIGALLAAATGVALFNYQVKQNEEGRREQLEAALVGELQATLDILEAQPDVKLSPPPGDEEEEDPVEVIFAHLEPVACEEVIRNALSSSRDVMALSHLARQMRHYNAVTERLEAFLDGTMVTNKAERDFLAAKDVKRVHEGLVSWCRTIIEDFKERGVEIPPRQYSHNPEAEPQESGSPN